MPSRRKDDVRKPLVPHLIGEGVLDAPAGAESQRQEGTGPQPLAVSPTQRSGHFASV